MGSFSQRYGYQRPKPIVYREQLPSYLRLKTLAWLRRYVSVQDLREIVCTWILKIVPNPLNRYEYLQDREVEEHIRKWAWFRTYDLLEIARELLSYQDQSLPEHEEKTQLFELNLNDFFVEHGIGWQFGGGKIIVREDEAFQNAIDTAIGELRKDERPTAVSHIEAAANALSQRPKANTCGAASHATSAVECVLNDITGEPMMLGKYLDRYPGLFHPALKKALDGVYGYASDRARHGREGLEPTFEEAQFVVVVCAAASTLLTHKNPKSKR